MKNFCTFVLFGVECHVSKAHNYIVYLIVKCDVLSMYKLTSITTVQHIPSIILSMNIETKLKLHCKAHCKSICYRLKKAAQWLQAASAYSSYIALAEIFASKYS